MYGIQSTRAHTHFVGSGFEAHLDESTLPSRKWSWLKKLPQHSKSFCALSLYYCLHQQPPQLVPQVKELLLALVLFVNKPTPADDDELVGLNVAPLRLGDTSRRTVFSLSTTHLEISK